jgi:hypothetical protein
MQAAMARVGRCQTLLEGRQVGRAVATGCGGRRGNEDRAVEIRRRRLPAVRRQRAEQRDAAAHGEQAAADGKVHRATHVSALDGKTRAGALRAVHVVTVTTTEKHAADVGICSATGGHARCFKRTPMHWSMLFAPLPRARPAVPLPPSSGTALQWHAQVLARALGRPLSGGNRVEPLDDASELQRMLDGARDHVNFDGDPDADAHRARVLGTHGEGHVAINLLRAGWLGRLRGARALVLVVDGRVAFVGRREAPLRLEGPAVAELQRRFVRRWQQANRAELPRARYFPPLPPAGDQRVGLPQHARALDQALHDAVQAARRRIVVGAAATLRRPRLHAALADAAARGVAVQHGAGEAVVIDGVWTLPSAGALVVLDPAFAARTEQRLLQ